MPGPGVAAYLILSVILFATGAFGVLIRRSPLIVLLALEIMLNAGNLALIAFARQTGTGTGQIFALTVMVVAAAEAVVGLGLIVAVSRRHVELDVDKLTTLARMIAAAWIALFAPAAAVVAIALAGTGITRSVAGFLAAGSALVSFVAPWSSSPSCSARIRRSGRTPRRSGPGSRPATSRSARRSRSTRSRSS